MYPYERYHLILSTAKEKRFVRIEELLGLTRSSLTTLRNDIDYLFKNGKIKKIRGGIEYIEESSSFVYRNRESQNHSEKDAIGLYAQGFVEDGDVLLLTNGTTTSMVAKHIDPAKHLTIITNGIDIALKLKEKPNITVILLGGIVDYTSFIVSGHTVFKMLESFNPTKAILGAGGITEEKGITIYDMVSADGFPKMLKSIDTIIVVADHSKIGRNVLAHVAPVDIIDTLITDSGVDPKYIERLEKCGIHCVLAEV